MKQKSLFKGLCLALVLACSGFSSNAHAYYVSITATNTPAWAYIWAQNVGSTSISFPTPGTYTWPKDIPPGTLVQVTTSNSYGTRSVAFRIYSNVYFRI